MSSTTPSYWCYRCSRFVRVWNEDSIICPDCDTGFIEQIDNPPSRADTRRRTRRFPGAALYIGTIDTHNTNSNTNSPPPPPPVPRRTRRNGGGGVGGGGGDRTSPFNPVIVLRGPSDRNNNNNTITGGGVGGGFDLYYDDGGGSGLRPLPPTMSEFLLGSGFDRLLEQLSQMEVNSIRLNEHPPASKAAIESMPTLRINTEHTEQESHCAVCKEPFELGAEAREMPCKHIYHSDCILPWLCIRNSCPVCRHELPASVVEENGNSNGVGVGVEVEVEEEQQQPVGLTIWRLPGGGFAVGRFAAGAMRGGGGGERELPVVFTEMDGGFNNGVVSRRVSWGERGGSGGGRERSSGFLGRVLRNMFGCFGGGGGGSGGESSGSSSSSDLTGRRRRSRSVSLFNRRRRGWGLEIDSGRRW